MNLSGYNISNICIYIMYTQAIQTSESLENNNLFFIAFEMSNINWNDINLILFIEHNKS